MNEERQSDFVKLIRFGERQRPADKACQALAQGQNPALNMRSQAGFLPHRLMGFRRKHLLVGLPEIAKRGTGFVAFRDGFPQLAAGGGTAVADDKGYHLAGSTTQSQPNPAFLALFEHKRPQFVKFQHISGLWTNVAAKAGSLAAVANSQRAR